MGLFDKIKKAAPTVGATTAAGAAAAAGVYAGEAFAQDKHHEGDPPDQKLDGAPSPTNPEHSTMFSTNAVNPDAHPHSMTGEIPPESIDHSALQHPTNESPESIYDSETGVTTHHYLNGNTLTEDSDGTRAWHDMASKETVVYNPETGNSTTYGAASDVWTEEDPDDISTAAQNGTLDSNSLIQTLAKQAGMPPEGEAHSNYEVKAGWEANYNNAYSGSDEVAPGMGLNSEASYNAAFFAGAYSKGDAGAEWNTDQAHLHAHTRSMVGLEASQDASYKGTLEVEGINYQPGAEVQGHTNAFAGAEVEGGGDLNVSSDGAYGSLGGEAFAGAKAEAGGSGAMSIDGNEFARGEGGVDARAGVGVDANIDAGYQDGHIQYGVDMGAAVGVGAGYHYSGSVDAPGIITHPDAVWESAVHEIPSISTDPSTYTDHAEHYVVEQFQDYVPSIPVEVSHVAEVISDPGNAVEDFGHSLGF